MLLRASLTFAILSLLFGCATGPITQIDHKQGELRGMLYDLERQPLADASVTLTIDGAPVTVVTDLHGRFSLGVVKFGSVTLDIVKPGYESVHWPFQFFEGSQVLYLQMPSSDQLFERAAAALEKKEWSVFEDNLVRARALTPDSLQGYILRTLALESQGSVGDAIAELNGYPTTHPVLAVELLLGDLYSASGDREQAVAHWTKALEMKEDAGVRAKISGSSSVGR